MSHSKKDKEFIHELCKDLHSCQIEPWLDSQEIRHGQPWLDAIFESGIPTCDVILVYLTENSVESAMVKKEIDASMIKKLKESHVAFLPYVSKEIIREKLRMDIQTLQTPVWNKENYAEMLPRVVAEIWHSYLDSMVMSVANQEKVRRLEAELELEKLKKTGMESIFEAKEIADFEFIWRQFGHKDIIKLEHIKLYKWNRTEEVVSCKSFCIEIQTIIPLLDRIVGGRWDYPQHVFLNIFQIIIKNCYPNISEDERIRLYWKNLTNFMNQLKMYGILKKSPEDMVTEYAIIMSTDKFDRFKYWLYYKGILSNEIKWNEA